MVEYIYLRAEAAGLEPTILHYARFQNHSELHASLANLLHGELNLWPTSKDYVFNGMNRASPMMRARANGATLPEWEPNRLHANRLWRKSLSEFDKFILVTGSAQTGLPLTELEKPFAAWVSSTVETDRRERLMSSTGISNWIEKAGLNSVLQHETKVLQSASSIMAVSEDAKKHLLSLAGKEISVWPYPIDTQKFIPSYPSNTISKKRFLFVGRANDPRKRIELFFRACNALRKKNPNLDFIAMVVSSEIPHIKNLNFEIEHLRNLSEEKLIELYQTSTAFVMTSEQEGLGIAAMEAMACGLPVISTRCGGPATFIEDSISGFFVDNSPDAIAERMLQLATNDNLRTKLGKASRDRIENHFSENIWNKRFEKMLNNLS